MIFSSRTRVWQKYLNCGGKSLKSCHPLYCSIPSVWVYLADLLWPTEVPHTNVLAGALSNAHRTTYDHLFNNFIINIAPLEAGTELCQTQLRPVFQLLVIATTQLTPPQLSWILAELGNYILTQGCCLAFRRTTSALQHDIISPAVPTCCQKLPTNIKSNHIIHEQALTWHVGIYERAEVHTLVWNYVQGSQHLWCTKFAAQRTISRNKAI